MNFLLKIPLPLSVFLVLIFSISISFFCLRFVKRKIPHEILRENHEVAGYMFNAFSIMFSVLISFVVYINWSDYNDARKNVYMEINAQSNIFHHASGFPDSTRLGIQKSVLEYCKAVCYDEWDEMQFGKRSQLVEDAYNNLWNKFLIVEDSSIQKKSLFDECMHEMNKLSDSRRLRYLFIENTIPGIVWFVLLLSAVMSISFIYFFSMKKKIPHFMFIITFSTVIFLILFLIFVFDHPYMRDYMITSEPFRDLIKQMESILLKS
jgi:hypothetical protein